MAAGRFISLEGGDGSGKSTQIRMLANRLRDAGHNVVETRDPGGTLGAEAIRQLVLTGDPERWDVMTETLLHFAARRDYTERLIRPALEDGKWVITDRFADSTSVYQGVARGLGISTVRRLWDLAIDGFKPDLTLIIDIPADEGLKRADARNHIEEAEEAREDRYEKLGTDIHDVVRQAFLDLAEAEPDRCHLIDGTKDAKAVHEAVWAVVIERLEV